MFSFLGNPLQELSARTETAAIASVELESDPVPEIDVDGETVAPTLPPRPLERCGGGVALALGGGAAKGWAHIGVLRAFEEAGIPVSMVAGTSIGALVGGCFMAGKLDALEEFARSLTRAGMLRYMDFSIAGSGLISGAKLANHMKTHLDGVDIETLGKPFVSICTDIATGHEIWLHDGPLIHAIRASYALPGVFAPVAHGGRHLVDGAIVNPVPVSACRAYEPELVIAVDLNSETFGRGTVIRASHYSHRELEDAAALLPGSPDQQAAAAKIRRANAAPKSRLGMMGVMMEAFSIIQDRIARARLAGDPPDFTIRPRLAGIGLADFHKADEAIETGYQTARVRLGELIEQGDLAIV